MADLETPFDLDLVLVADELIDLYQQDLLEISTVSPRLDQRDETRTFGVLDRLGVLGVLEMPAAVDIPAIPLRARDPDEDSEDDQDRTFPELPCFADIDADQD
jgi:hypothetical protein